MQKSYTNNPYLTEFNQKNRMIVETYYNFLFLFCYFGIIAYLCRQLN